MDTDFAAQTETLQIHESENIGTLKEDGNGSATTEKLTKALGFFSVGLGLAEIIAPRQVAKFIGIKHQPGLLRAMGVREITSGLGILLQRRRPAMWVWSRVGGDAVDLALLGTALTPRNRMLNRTLTATAAVAGVAAVDFLCARRLSRHHASGNGAIHVTYTITINRSAEDLYAFWRNFENLPCFMNHLESVHVTGPNRSHWIAKGPAGKQVEWDAEIINEHPNELIAWRSLENSDVDNAGTVRFVRGPVGRGTVVKVEFQYRPPAGSVGAAVARMFGQAPEKQVRVDLRRFKQLMETGEIPTIEGQSAGRASSTSKKFDDVLQS